MHTGRMAPAEHDQAGRRAGGAHRPRIASARRRVLDLPVHDPQALVRVGPDNLVAGDPAGMLSRSVDLERLRLDGPVLTEHAAPVQPGLAGIVVGEQLGRTSAARPGSRRT
jgi:hypothetical protein